MMSVFGTIWARGGGYPKISYPVCANPTVGLEGRWGFNTPHAAGPHPVPPGGLATVNISTIEIMHASGNAAFISNSNCSFYFLQISEITS